MKIMSYALGAVCATLLASQAIAATEVVVVAGSANPFLAGAPAGTNCCGGDIAPANSPAQLVAAFAPGSTFTFSATGLTDGAGTGPTAPDGAYLINMGSLGTGIAPADQVRVLGLVGVFLTSAAPAFGTFPAGIDFSSGLNFASFSPGLAQIFWIGDGLTGTGTGTSQLFTAPTGATRLFLGTVDGSGWFNNTGAYAATVNFTPQASSGAVPEPATWTMMIFGFGAIGGATRRRRGTVPQRA